MLSIYNKISDYIIVLRHDGEIIFCNEVFLKRLNYNKNDILNLNINEIASEVGFTYPRYFSSTFKQMKGVTPKQFREENRIK